MNKRMQAASETRPSVRDADVRVAGEIAEPSNAAAGAVCLMLGTSPEGLEADKVAARLASDGPNRIAKEDRPSVVKELWGRAKNPLNALLLSLAAASYFLGDLRAAVVILVMVVLAITTGFVQEHRSNNAAAKLRAMVKTTASVKRRGAAVGRRMINLKVLPRLRSTSSFPATSFGSRPATWSRRTCGCRAKDLFISQSALTGEAMPSEKTGAARVGDRRCARLRRTCASWART